MTEQNEHRYDTIALQAKVLSDIIAQQIKAGGHGATLLLPGGSSPRTVIAALATRSDIKWDNIHVSVGD